MSAPPDPPSMERDVNHHLLVQAPVPAVDVDGIRVVTVGTTLFAVASVLAYLLRPRLIDEGRGWWLWVCVCGFGLGLVGLLLLLEPGSAAAERHRPDGARLGPADDRRRLRLGRQGSTRSRPESTFSNNVAS